MEALSTPELLRCPPHYSTPKKQALESRMVRCGCYEYHYRPVDRKRVPRRGGGRDDEHIAKENKVGYTKVLSKLIIFCQ